MSPTLLHISGDLMLGGPVKTAAEAAGFDHQRALSETNGLKRIAELSGAVVLVDLDLAELDLDSIQSAAAKRDSIVAVYGPHVRTELFDSATSSGVTAQFTRGMLAGRGREVMDGLKRLVESEKQGER